MREKTYLCGANIRKYKKKISEGESKRQVSKWPKRQESKWKNL